MSPSTRMPAGRLPGPEAARTVAFHPEQGWSLLCNGLIVFDDLGEILPDGRVTPPPCRRARSGFPRRRDRSGPRPPYGSLACIVRAGTPREQPLRTFPSGESEGAMR